MLQPAPMIDVGAFVALAATLIGLRSVRPLPYLHLWAGAWLCGALACLPRFVREGPEALDLVRWLALAIHIALLVEGARRFRGYAAIGRTPWLMSIVAITVGLSLSATAPLGWAEGLITAGAAFAASYVGVAVWVDRPSGWGSWVAGMAHVGLAGLGLTSLIRPLGPWQEPVRAGLATAVAVGMVGLTVQRALSRAHRQQERYRELFDGLVDGRLRLDDSGTPTYANRSLARLLGFDEPAELLAAEPAEVFGDTLTELLADQDGGARQVRWTRRDGRAAWVTLRLRSRTDHIEVYVDDTTKARTRALAVHRDEKLMALGQLAGGVAHDFNNLLAVIAGSLDLAAATRDDPTHVARHLTRARSATDRGTRLTRRLRDFARHRPERLEVFDLNDAVGGSMEMLGHTLTDHIQLEFSGQGPAWVKGDRGQMDRMLMNLVFNARDAMPEGGTIRVQVAHAGQHVSMTVRDEGSGIDPADLPRIFDPFFTTRSHGTGLGLATVYGIVTAADGTIDVTSTHEGTTVEVSLPRATRAEHRQPLSFPPPPTHRRTILLADDEAALREVAAEILVDAGFRVLQASNGSEALEVARTNGYLDLLVTDVVMPQMSGSQLADALQERFPELPVVLVSGFPDRNEPVSCLDGPMRRFLSKPYRRRELLQAVREALALRV
ncbi:MAG: response regulator [Myxococcales bacterium]|nr:response regulator [Myxococcales bacterium]